VSRREQLRATRAELSVQAGEEIDRVLREDVLCTVRHVETLDPAVSGEAFVVELIP
jgi:hypothetical protein